ncbi:hypothetical protein CDAR_537461 [Caerostris darwini]|uniref:Uncharacterized protein n=1 Tax=Caerostris darwini TaxID=1538125 RepID=A0AAV4Q7L6_9ARAC|nr:hypothetical protein CDAR_537461 [Caerostris darwini]
MEKIKRTDIKNQIPFRVQKIVADLLLVACAFISDGLYSERLYDRCRQISVEEVLSKEDLVTSDALLFLY